MHGEHSCSMWDSTPPMACLQKDAGTLLGSSTCIVLCEGSVYAWEKNWCISSSPEARMNQNDMEIGL